MFAERITRDSNAFAIISFSKWQLGAYHRISQEDRKIGESASITNQRALIKDFIKRTEEFAGAGVIEYVDDGLSGATTDRDDYNRMMRDVESGRINCIIVKDLKYLKYDIFRHLL